MIVITFAVPEESSRFRRSLQGVRRAKVGTLGVLEGRIGSVDVIVAHIGMGLEAAAANTTLLLKERRPEAVIAAGFGGALMPELHVGDIVVDPRTWPGLEESPGQELSTRCQKGSIVSQAFPAETPREKAQLAKATGAWVVDMETEAIATACAQAGVPLLAVRAISDGSLEPLPVPLPAWFDIKAQRPRPAVLVGYLLTHPGVILPFIRFLKGLPAAQRALAGFLSAFLERYAHAPCR
ncbi:phosphorylase family protein [Verrucomicrobiota bacterium sgz303538]